MIAQELYRLIREVERLEKDLKKVPFEQQASIKDLLRKAKAERDRLRAILEGKKVKWYKKARPWVHPMAFPCAGRHIMIANKDDQIF